MKRQKVFSPPLDSGIEAAVIILRGAGVETFESCEGSWTFEYGKHSYPEPTVRFHGNLADGMMALGVALRHTGLRVKQLRQVWDVLDGAPTGPTMELVFGQYSPSPPPKGKR